MPAVSSIIAAVGVSAALAGTAVSVYGAHGQAETQQQQSYNNLMISNLQQLGTRVQRSALASNTDTQTALLELQRQQNQLRIATDRGVIEQQRSLEDIRQANNQLLRGSNVDRRNAAIGLEGLNQQNDVLNTQSYASNRSTAYSIDTVERARYGDVSNTQARIADRSRSVDTLQTGQEDLTRAGFVINRQRDALASQAERTQQGLADLQYKNQVRDAIRQGIVQRASGLSAATNRGAGEGGTQAAGLQSNAITAARLAISDATRAKGGSDVLRGISRQDRLAQVQGRLLGEQNFELGSQIRGQNIQSRELGYELGQRNLTRNEVNRETQFSNSITQMDLGENSRNLAVSARGINFNLALGQFDLAENQFNLNDQTFGVNRNISDIYLNAQDQNAGLVNQASELNTGLLQANAGTNSILYGLQDQIYGLGGQNNLLAGDAAAYGGLTAIGGGLLSAGTSFVNNSDRLGRTITSIGNYNPMAGAFSYENVG